MIFKKQISFLIALLVLVSNSGLAFNIHFCEGKIASISSVFSKEEVCDIPVEIPQTCCSKIETTHKKCCSDQEVNLKDDVEKALLKFSFETNSVFVYETYSPLIFKNFTLKKSKERVAYHYDANAPPLYQLYCQYTFYA